MPKVSVIIPIYNTEKYLKKCLDSVCNQTLSDIEILCINDCSTDNSLKILQESALRDFRIKIINLDVNKGASNARNLGIEYAKGEFLSFIDSDDYIDLDFYEKLYKKAINEDLDCVKGNYKDAQYGYVDYELNKKILEDKNNFSFAYCSAIFKKKIIDKYYIKFPQLCDMEDPIFTYLFALRASKISVIDDAYIYIVKRDDSQTTSLPNYQRISDRLEGLKKIVSLAENADISEFSYCFTLSFWVWNVFVNSIKTVDLNARKYLINTLLGLCSTFKYIDCFWSYLEKQNSYFKDWLQNGDKDKLLNYEKYIKIAIFRNKIKNKG